MNTKTTNTGPQGAVRWFDSAALDALQIRPDDVVACIERAVRDWDDGNAWATPKSSIRTDDGRYFMSTLAATDSPGVVAVKALVMNPNNASRGIPQISSLVTLLDSDTGVPLAVVDGSWITARRTAGLSATAAKHLARTDASVVAFVGCGVQALNHLETFAPLFPLTEARLLGRGGANIERLGDRADRLGLNVTVCTNAPDVVATADIVVTSISYTRQTEGFIDAALLEPGCFAAITDLGTPWISSSLDAFDRIIIDDLQQEAAMASPLARAERVQGDLAQLVLGKTSGRRRPEERNAFLFRGHALGDVALSALVWERASAQRNV